MIIKIIIASLIIILGALLIKKFTSITKRHIRLRKKDIDGNYSANFAPHFPYQNTAILDLHAKGERYLFIGGNNQADKLFLLKDEQLIDVSEQVGLGNFHNNSYCAIAVDVNGNGLPDLFVARRDGIYLYENLQGIFNIKKLNINLADNHIPIFMAITDLQKTGAVDLFLTTYCKSNKKKQQTNNWQSFVFKNNGDNSFTELPQIT
ncbi:FG-GAP repeat domain-containing protein [Legionella sp. D16C41]|uniref:FG-GAP repeat domain-containing protein n=1 Tax=Legionella sp. D16C41 TaxID=3402688 RepID=UPI003AF488A0